MEICGHTMEKVQPVFSNRNITFEMIEQVLELRNEMNEMKQKMTEMENKKCLSSEINANVWNLSVEVNEMKRVMLELEKRQNDGEEKMSSLNCRVDNLEADLKEETTGLKKIIIDVQKEQVKSAPGSVSLSLDEHKSRIIKLETKTDNWFDILEFNKWKNNELTHQMKYEFEKELKTTEIEMKSEIEKFEQTMNEMVVSQEKKWAETKERVIHTLKDEKERREKMTSNLNKNTLNLLTLSAQTDSLNRDLQNQVLKPISNFHKRFETLNLSFDEMHKTILAQVKKMAGVEIRVIQHSDQISEIKKELSMNEDKNTMKNAPSTAQDVFHSLIKPEDRHLRKVGEYYKAKPDFTWTVKGVKSLENGSQKELLSEIFPLRKYPFGAQAKITLYANSFQFYLSYKDINKTNRQIRIQPIPNIYLTLKDRSDNQENKDIIGTHYFTYFKEKLEYNTFYPLYLRNVDKRTLNSSTYNVDDEVVLDIHVESPDVAQLVYSYDGTLTWAIDDHSKRKQSAVDGLVVSYLSPYFYTHSNGYRVRVRVYLNGFDEYETKGLTVAYALLTGVYDDFLDENFPHKTTITVFDPTQPARNINKSVENDTRNCHWVNMGAHEEIQDLIYNDTLYYRVTVEAKKPLT